jgi:hypothetical protein
LSNGSNFKHSVFLGSTEQYRSTDLEVLSGYAFRFSEKSSIGVNTKFIYSDVILGLQTDSLKLSPAMAGAIDLSYGYLDENILLGKIKTSWSWGMILSNLGNKSFYTNTTTKNFLPANFRIGTSLGISLAANHKLILALDFNKLLVFNSSYLTNTDELSAIEGFFKSFTDSEYGFKGELREFTTGGGI